MALGRLFWGLYWINVHFQIYVICMLLSAILFINILTNTIIISICSILFVLSNHHQQEKKNDLFIRKKNKPMLFWFLSSKRVDRKKLDKKMKWNAESLSSNNFFFSSPDISIFSLFFFILLQKLFLFFSAIIITVPRYVTLHQNLDNISISFVMKRDMISF